jgi:hypothetical protein
MRRLYDDEKKSSVVIGFDAIKNKNLIMKLFINLIIEMFLEVKL